MSAQPTLPEIQKATFEDLKIAFSKGVTDFLKAPLFGMFFGGFFAAGGLFLIYGMFVLNMLWLSYPLIIGFSLIGPFIASGLYEVSRRLEANQALRWRDVLGVIWLQHKRELGWMAFVMLFIFWIWIYQIRTLVAVFFGSSGFADFSGFLDVVFSSQRGWNFLLVGHVIGAVISFVLYAITVISCPLLLDRDIDFVTAMVTSIRTILMSPIVMLTWGLLVISLTSIAALPGFLGLLFILPILGHSTWHLYRRLIK
ncbi:MAG: DUF2189 domain-containing protein [Pseudomonadota bacterium]